MFHLVDTISTATTTSTTGPTASAAAAATTTTAAAAANNSSATTNTTGYSVAADSDRSTAGRRPRRSTTATAVCDLRWANNPLSTRR